MWYQPLGNKNYRKTMWKCKHFLLILINNFCSWDFFKFKSFLERWCLSWALALLCAITRVFPLQMGYTGVCSGLGVAGFAQLLSYNFWVSQILALRCPWYNDNISKFRMCQIISKCLLSPKTRSNLWADNICFLPQLQFRFDLWEDKKMILACMIQYAWTQRSSEGEVS